MPGQDFNPPNDLVETNKCDGIYEGPEIEDTLTCSVNCPEDGSDVALVITEAGTSIPIEGARLVLTLFDETIIDKTSNGLGVIEFNVPFDDDYEYKITKSRYYDAEGTLVVDGCVNQSIGLTAMEELPLNPFNIHGFLTVTPPIGESVGRYPLSQFFGVPLNPVIPPGNAYRTRWRIQTDACGHNITYYTGDLDDNGMLLTTGPFGGGSDGSYSGFNPETMEFISRIYYPEGMWLQLGVLINGIWTWLPAAPCITGGNQTPI